MKSRRRTLRREARFDRPVDEIWTLLSDTQRMNEIAGAGFVPYVVEEKPAPNGRVERHASKPMGPFNWRWREGMGEWTDKRTVTQRRRFENGPFRELTVDVTLEPDGDGTRVLFDFLGEWDNLAGALLNAVGFLDLITMPPVASSKKLVEAAPRGRPAETLMPKPPKPGRGVEDRLRAALGDGDTAKALETILLKAFAPPLKRMRPLEFARRWGADPAEVTETFVRAHRAEALAMRWEVMCPRCRGGKAKATLLSDVPREVHCASCNIDYERDFANNVELVFSPTSWVRTLPEAEFCMMSPAHTPHVKLQCDVAAGAERAEALTLEDGRYRIRTVEAGGERAIDVFGGALPLIVVDGDEISLGDEIAVGEARMRNGGGVDRSIVIESEAWSTDCLTAPKVLAMPAFRELCPEQLLSPGDEVAIDRVAILFSDLKSSTALYEEIGDSRAFRLVQDHFRFLNAAVAEESGAVVKTIGDSVMATFDTGRAGLAAALAMQKGVAAFNVESGGPPLELKVGVHVGNCIAITSNDRIDYFGAAVNLAARLQGAADAGEVVVSEAVAATPEAQGLLSANAAQAGETALPGIATPVRMFRIQPSKT